MNTIATNGVIDYAAHTTYTDPGRYGALFDATPSDLNGVSAVALNLVEHYRASDEQLSAETVSDIHSRWVARILQLDQQRHGEPLATPREPAARVQGCCRDHTLLSVAMLRHHGVPARSRVGFADYFMAGWHHDHVIAEMWTGERWRRFDPELPAPTELLPDPRNILPRNGFHTAAEVWRGHRAGTLDVERYGVDVSDPVARGAWFVRNYVVMELAHRYGDEVLLWDHWGTMNGPGSGDVDIQLIDEVAALLLAADAGDTDAEQRLHARYLSDERLHPGDTVLRVDLPGEELVRESLFRHTH